MKKLIVKSDSETYRVAINGFINMVDEVEDYTGPVLGDTDR